MKVLKRARQLEAAGRHVIHMEVGEPDFITAAPIVEAGRKALAHGHTQYSNAAGLSALREAISRNYQSWYGVDVDPERIFITPGASGGLNLLANLLVNPGDGILMSDPAYPCNRNFIRLMGGEAQLVPVTGATNFQPDVPLLEKFLTPNTSGLWLASPANPTGTVIERPRLAEMVLWAQRRGLHVVMDEIYHGLHYVDDLPSLLEISPQGFVVNSFSKYFGMTGWRIGWIVVPPECAEIVDVLCQNLFIAASTVAQHAALAAFLPDTLEILEQRREEFRRRRDFLASALGNIGFGIEQATEGAFYVYASIERFCDDSEVFCQDLLEKHGVAITPGTDFGDYRALSFVRLAFTTSMENLEQGVERLARALAA